MSAYDVVALFITAAAAASYLNYRFLKLPSTIGLMVLALAFSLLMIGLDKIGFDFAGQAEGFLQNVDFSTALMQVMLSFLLFAGALHININDLSEQKFIIGSLATIGVVASTFIVGTAMFYVLGWLDLQLPYIYCLVFGALISPTDPIAVMAILKSAGATKSLSTKMAGESLFNDGVGVVVFVVLVGIAAGGGDVSWSHVGLLFLEEAVGGVLFGLAIGWLGYLLLKEVDAYVVEVLITLALVAGGYSLALAVHTSGPIAIVVAGLLIGNHGRKFAMTETTRRNLDLFWELVDETLNAVLFVWIGMEILVLTFSLSYFIAGVVAIPVALIARYLSVKGAMSVLRFKREFSRNADLILSWGGLRGGISIALALSLAAGPTRDLIVSMTYVIVVFSIMVQGLTIGRLVKASVQKN